MKKLLASKKKYTEEKNNIHLNCNPPKRTVTSTWIKRNESTNISSILQPENYTLTPKHKSLEMRAKGVHKKCFLSRNSCYCRENKIRPKLMSRPKTCLSLEDFKKQFEGVELLRRSFTENALPKCGLSHHDFSSVEVEHEYQKSLPNACSCLEYTDLRKNYELFRDDQKEEDLKELEEYEYNELLDRDKSIDHKNEEDSYSFSTILGTRLGTTKTTLSYEPQEQTDVNDDDELNDFRKEHYFETHSTGDILKDLPKHSCIHKFKLDDRLLPEPLNVDPFGRSRCSVCSKPMMGDTLATSKSLFKGRPSTVSIRNFAKCSELGLVPRTVSIGDKNSKIQLGISARENEKFGVFFGKMKKPEYFNTYALRQQRMSF